MLDTLTSHRDADDFNTVPGGWPDPGGFLPEARTGAREAAARMKDLAERFAELRNAIMRLPGNPSRGERAGLRHRLLHLENMLMSARGSLDDASSSPSWTRTTQLPDDPRGVCPRSESFRAKPCHATEHSGLPRPASTRVEEGKGKGDASKGKESSLRAASQPYQAEMQNVRSHS